jgi:5'-hydroxyaverantin dehydrogenase
MAEGSAAATAAAAAAAAYRRPEVTYVTPRIDFSEEFSTATVKGRSALVTGGALGIGAGCATGLAEAG